jgi:hypothetical protein
VREDSGNTDGRKGETVVHWMGGNGWGARRGSQTGRYRNCEAEKVV